TQNKYIRMCKITHMNINRSTRPMKTLIIISLFLSVSISTFSQKTDKEVVEFVSQATTKQLVDESTELLMNGRYRMAIIVAEKLIEKEPSNSNFIYRKGYALSKQSEQIDEAILLLQSVSENTTKKYDASSAKEDKAPIDALYHLASCYHQ